MEIWKDIKGFEGYYQVSNNGRIKALPRLISRPKNGSYLRNEFLLKPNILKNGYVLCHLKHKKNNLSTSVHRIVANHFLPNPENKKTVNHKNGIKSDNMVGNLEWATYSENRKHAYESGIQKPTIGIINGMSKLNENQVFDIKYNSKGIKICDLMEKYSISRSCIFRIQKNILWKNI